MAGFQIGFHSNALRVSVNLVLGALCLYLMFSPVWLPSILPRMYDNARVFELTVLCLVSLSLLARPLSEAVSSIWLSLATGARWLLIVFIAGGAASAVVSTAPQMGLLQLGLNVQLITLFFLVGASVRIANGAAEKALALGVFVGAGLIGLKFWVTYGLYFAEGKIFSWVSPFMDFANVRFFGQYQAYALLLVGLPVAAVGLTGARRYLVYFVAANFWALQWMVGSRAVWVGFFVAVLATCIALSRKRLDWLTSQMIPVLAGGLIYALFSWLIVDAPKATPIPPINSIVERSGESDKERMVLATSALQLIAAHPLAGVGPGQFGLHYSKTTAAHPHNSLLQLLTEYGIPAGLAGVGLGVILVLFALKEIRERSRQSADPVTATLGAALIMGLVDSLFSGNLIMPHSQFLLCVTAGWLFGRTGTIPTGIYLPDPRKRELILALSGLAIAAAAITAVLAFEYIALIRNMPYPGALRIPNFWQYGRFSAW
jgi:O-antigen ligase